MGNEFGVFHMLEYEPVAHQRPGDPCKKLLSVSLSLDLASSQPTPGSALLGRGKVMAVLLLEAKPSLEAKVKDRRSGASALRAPPHVGLPRAPALLQTSAPHVDVVHTQLLGWRC